MNEATQFQIATIIIAIGGLITACCVGIRKLHLRKLKSACCEVDLESQKSDTTDDKENNSNHK